MKNLLMYLVISFFILNTACGELEGKKDKGGGGGGGMPAPIDKSVQWNNNLSDTSIILYQDESELFIIDGRYNSDNGKCSVIIPLGKYKISDEEIPQDILEHMNNLNKLRADKTFAVYKNKNYTIYTWLNWKNEGEGITTNNYFFKVKESIKSVSVMRGYLGYTSQLSFMEKCNSEEEK